MDMNDNDPAGSDPAPDAHGVAALLLVESLIHGLCEKSTLTTEEAIEVVERAVSVQFDRAEAAGDEARPLWRSHEMLSSIAASLETDRDDRPPPPRLVD